MAAQNNYTEEEKQQIFDMIIQKISEDSLSLRKAVYEVGLVEPYYKVSKSTFLDWVANDNVKADQYARAIKERQEGLFEEIIEIADDDSNDYEEIELGDGVIATKVNHEHIQRSRLRVDARKWALSKMNPKKYGDKVDLTTDGKEINNAPTIVFKKFKNDE